MTKKSRKKSKKNRRPWWSSFNWRGTIDIAVLVVKLAAFLKHLPDWLA